MHSFHANMILNKLMDLLVCVHIHDDEEEKQAGNPLEGNHQPSRGVHINPSYQRILI